MLALWLKVVGIGWNEIGNRWYFDEVVGNAVHHDECV